MRANRHRGRMTRLPTNDCCHRHPRRWRPVFPTAGRRILDVGEHCAGVTTSLREHTFEWFVVVLLYEAKQIGRKTRAHRGWVGKGHHLRVMQPCIKRSSRTHRYELGWNWRHCEPSRSPLAPAHHARTGEQPNTGHTVPNGSVSGAYDSTVRRVERTVVVRIRARHDAKSWWMGGEGNRAQLCLWGGRGHRV